MTENHDEIPDRENLIGGELTEPDADGFRLDELGNRVDDSGQRVDEDGNPVDAEGDKIDPLDGVWAPNLDAQGNGPAAPIPPLPPRLNG